MYTSVIFELCNHHHNPALDHLFHLRNFTCAHWPSVHIPVPSSRQHWSTLHLLKFGFCRDAIQTDLASFTEHDVSEVLPWCCMYQLFTLLLLVSTPSKYHILLIHSTGGFSDSSNGKMVKILYPVRSLGWEDPLEEEMATHSSILVWRIPWTEESGKW